MTIESILEGAPRLAREWAAQRDERQQRTEGNPDDYRQLAELGVPMMAVPTEFGGTWETQAQSARPNLHHASHPGYGRPFRDPVQRHAPFGALVLAGARSPGTLVPGVGQATPGSFPDGARWRLVGHDYFRAGQRRRHQLKPRPVRARGAGIPEIPHDRQEALRQRHRDDLLYDHPGRTPGR